MKNKLFTFRPNIWIKFMSILAWAECQLRSDWINWRCKPAVRAEFVAALKSRVSLLLTQAQGYWDCFNVRNSSKVFGEDCVLSISCTDTLTPILLFMHFRLRQEVRFYALMDARKAAQEEAKHVRMVRTISRLMPTWVKFQNSMDNLRKQEEKDRWKADWKLRLEVDEIGAGIFRHIAQYLLAAFVICFLAAVGYRTVSNPGQIVAYLARIISGSVLPFNEAYGALAIVLIVLSELVVMFLVISFHQPSTGDILDVLYDHDGNTQESMAEIAHTLEQEGVPSVEYRSADIPLDGPIAESLEKVGGNGHK